MVRRRVCTDTLLLLFALCFIPQARVVADRDIVYSAQSYRWVKNPDFGQRYQGRRILLSRHPYHLYQINPDGTGRRQITFGRHDDYSPRWSPNGKTILFTRDSLSEKLGSSLCLLPAEGRKVTPLYSLPSDAEEVMYHWSPNARHVALTFSRPRTQDTSYRLLVIDVRTRNVRTFQRVGDFAWSPDSRRLFLHGPNQVSEILDLRTGKRREIEDNLRNPTWLDAQTLVGDVTLTVDTHLERGVGRADVSGKVRQATRLRGQGNMHTDNAEPGDWMDGDQFYPRWRTWFPVPKHPGTFVAEATRDMSNGRHAWCAWVNIQTGRWHPLHAGRFLGFSPDGKRFAMAKEKWINDGTYRGRYCDPLVIVSTTTGRYRQIVGGLVQLAGGDWRRTASGRLDRATQ